MMIKKDTVSYKAILLGDELNDWLDRQMLAIERVSILLEDAKLDPNDELALDQASMDDLMELLSAYDEFLKHFKDTTVDTVASVKDLTTVTDTSRCNPCEDEDMDDVDDDALE